MSTANYAVSLAPKPAVAIRDQTPVPAWFSHTSPDLPSGLTTPTFPGSLTPIEQAEVRRWLAAPEHHRPTVLTQLTQRAAVAKVEEYVAYYADPKYLAWKASNELDRIGQWRNATGSAVIANIDALSKSLDGTGAGDPRPGDILLPGENEPS